MARSSKEVRHRQKQRARERKQEAGAKAARKLLREAKKDWLSWLGWRAEGANRRIEPPPCPRCGREWRVSDAEVAAPPETICPPCQRAC